MTEEIRLQAVERFKKLNLDEDPELQEIVELASAVCHTPYALVTILDNNTQYLKVRKGTDQMVIPREASFCTHAVEQHDIMVVQDMLKDDRFVNNPMVVNDPRIRFYAGVPLTTTDGYKLGTLCVLDIKQHKFSKHQQMVLKILSNQVMKIMELRIGTELLEKKQQELTEQSLLINDARTRLRSFFESSANFQVLLDEKGAVIDFNKTAFSFIEKVHHVILKRGDLFAGYITPDFVDTFRDRFARGLSGEKCVEEGSTDYGILGTVWWEASFEPALDQHNKIIGISYLIRNVTEWKLKEQKIIDQNESLLNIAHIQAHEFRGPLSTVMGMVNLMNTEEIIRSEHLPMLEKAVEKLDHTIRKIVKSIDQHTITNTDPQL